MSLRGKKVRDPSESATTECEEIDGQKNSALHLRRLPRRGLELAAVVLKYRDGNWSSSSAVPSGLPLGPVKKLSEQELQKLAKSKMPAAQQRWLHILLTKQAEETLTQSEKQVLQKLHRLYTQGTIRKSEALAELKRRELQQPN